MRWAFVLSFPLRWLVGGLIFIVGTLTHKYHWRSLGYYMLGVGGVLRVPVSGSLSILEPSKKHNAGRYWKSITATTQYDHDRWFYNTIGKAEFFSAQDTVYMRDTYKFYPWCHNPQHYSDCGCDSNADWAEIDIARIDIASTKLLPKIVCEGFCDGKIYLAIGKRQKDFTLTRKGKAILPCFTIKVNESRLLYVSISDEYFSLFGKPFLQVAKVSKQEGAVLYTVCRIVSEMNSMLKHNTMSLYSIRTRLQALFGYYPDAIGRRELWALVRKELMPQVRRCKIRKKVEKNLEPTIARAYLLMVGITAGGTL